MFITKGRIEIAKFDLEKRADMEALGELLSRPDVTILSRDKAKLESMEFEGETSSKDQRLIETVEYEVCSL